MGKSFRILYVATEIKPFLNNTYVSEIVRKLPQAMQEKGVEIRILVPKFGLINERKNRLHEVVRLSGVNIPIGDDDKPLIIKVASIPTAKLQVYFIDNEDYFKRKTIFNNKSGKFHSDNDEKDEVSPQLFSDEVTSETSSESNDQEVIKSDEEDFEIPAFLRKQKF